MRNIRYTFISLHGSISKAPLLSLYLSVEGQASLGIKNKTIGACYLWFTFLQGHNCLFLFSLKGTKAILVFNDYYRILPVFFDLSKCLPL